jgi:HlyD family secretion protein
MATTQPKRKRWLLYSLIGLALLLVAAAAIKARQKPKGEEVTMEKVQRRTIRETVSASGKIFPETEVKISSDVSGEIVELYVKEGDSVTVGQLMAKILPDEYQSAVEQGEAALSTAQAQKQISGSTVQGSTAQIDQLKAEKVRLEAQMRVAEKAYKRAEGLFKEGVIAQSEFETAEGNMRAAEAAITANDAALRNALTALASSKENVNVADFNIASQKANVKRLRTSLQKTLIRAPVSGIVSKLNVERGERVVGTLQMAGTEMMRIANLSSMEVQVEVSENDILKVALNDEVDIEADAYLGRKFKGKVSEIANSSTSVGVGNSVNLNTDQVTNFVVKVRVDPSSYSDLVKGNQRYPFRPGMSAAVDIFTQTADNTLSVPLIAVTTREEDKQKDEKSEGDDEEEENNPAAKQVSQKSNFVIKEIVFVAVGDTVTIRDVKTGIQDNDHIEIVSGLQEGETVVTGPYSAIARKLKNGTRIREKEEKKDKEKEAQLRIN